MSLKKLTTVDNSSFEIFSGVQNLETIYLPSQPPKTFHADVFPEPSKIKLVLPFPADYKTYDGISLNLRYDDNDNTWIWAIFIAVLAVALISIGLFYYFKVYKKNLYDLSSQLISNEVSFT